MNRWNIPKELEIKIVNRDKSCVYCHSAFNKNSYKERATWEHIDNNAKNITEENICLCCASCNASKGIKMIPEWFNTPYCQKKDINKDTVDNIVKKSIKSSY